MEISPKGSKYLKNFIFPFLFFLFFAPLGTTTTYFPLPIKKQLAEADGVMRGIFKGKNGKKMGDNRIFTEANFEVYELSGIGPNEIINKRNFKIYYLGGTYNGVASPVEGMAHFTVGEEVVLLLKKVGGVYILSNMGLGKYSLKEFDNELTLVSEVFPDHKELGKIKYDKFNEDVAQIFGNPLRKFNSDLYVESSKKEDVKMSRSPASISVEEAPSVHSSIIWYVIILALLGGVSIFVFNKE